MSTQDTAHDSPFTVRNLIYMAFRRKWLLLLGMATGLAAAVMVYLRTPPQFVSQAALLVLYVSDNIAAVGPGDGAITRPGNWGANVLNSEMQIIGSQIVAESVVEDLGIESIFAETDGVITNVQKAAERILKNLAMEIPPSSNIIRLSYRADTPETAQRVLDHLVSEYLERHQQIHSAAASFDYFTEKTEQLGAELRAREDELQSLKASLGVVSLDDALRVQSERIAHIQEDIEKQRGEVAGGEARVALLRVQIEGEAEISTPTDAQPEELTPLQELDRELALRRVVMLRDKEQELLSSFLPESVLVRNIREQITVAENYAGLNEGTTHVVLASTESVDETKRQLVMERARIASSQAMIEVLEEQEAQAVEKLAGLRSNERRIVDLERQCEILSASYHRFSDALGMAKSNLALAPEQLSNISEAQPATLPVRPERREMRKKVLMAGAAGAALPWGLALVLEVLAANALRRPSDVERALNVPTLAAIPFHQGLRKPFAQDDPARLLRDPNVGSPPGDAPPGGARFLDDAVEGYFDTLRHRVHASGVLDGEVPHLVGVASCKAGAGTTTVATGLALAMSAVDDENVLFVDGNLRVGGAARMLGIPASSDVPHALPNGGSSVPVQQGLDFLPSGNVDRRLVRTSIGRRFRDLVSYLRDAQYSTVIVDLPPVDDASSTLQLAGLLDGVILVIESEKVSREKALTTLQQLRSADANVIGVVFNKKRDYVPDWLESAV